ncbi:hypothetical protein PVK06_036300 [Gossypium arboreum]|uniref:Aminotransferase-like plant mobile domain-containing protein n=1 Tax=Gossypium arboreum TaxID=29729 RepID=A0ABR0NLK9_GOSAR|nr:hypothetical protein PVK06_036300 [Gossypium arboreum]
MSARSQGICQQSASLRKRFVHISRKRFPEDAICTDVDKTLPQGRAFLVFSNGQKFDRWAPNGLPTGHKFLACGHDRPGVQVGPETNQCVNREVETRDAHFLSSMRRVYYHFGRRGVAIRIAGGWDTFSEPDNDSTELERIRYARAYILEMIGGYLMPDLSRNRVHLKWLMKHVDFRAAGEISWGSAVLATLYREMWNHSASYAGIPISLEDIRLLLDQRSETQDELFQNPNVWHVNVSLVNYAIVEMHQLDRVLRQFGFRQPIPVAPEVLDDEHKMTYGNCIWIDRYITQHISKCGRTGMIIYLLGNRSSFLS